MNSTDSQTAQAHLVGPLTARQPNDSLGKMSTVTYCQEESLAEFVEQIASGLGFETTGDAKSVKIQLPEELRTELGGREYLKFSEEAVPEEDVAYLIDRYRSQNTALHWQPSGTPIAVHKVTENLFPAYQVDGGKVHLLGCQLEPRPFVRLTYIEGKDVRHFFVAPDGSSVPEELANQLALATIQAAVEPMPKIGSSQLDTLVAAGRRMAAQQKSARNPSATVGPPDSVAVVWIKSASGTLQFTIGKESVQLPFDGWAKTLEPPAYECPVTKKQTYSLAAVEDGRIVPAEEIAKCEKTGERHLKSDMIQCAATGVVVLPEFIVVCPVLGKPVLKDRLVKCDSCQQHVSPLALEAGSCKACRCLKKTASSKRPIAALQTQHPKLAAWKWWRLAETEQVYIIRAANLLKQLFIVCDRRTLKVLHLATKNRGSSSWNPATKDRYAEHLG